MVLQSPHSLQSSVPTPTNGAKRVKIHVENGAAPKDNVSGERRVSARLQAAAKQKAEKNALLAKRKLELLDEDGGRRAKKLSTDTEKVNQKLKLQHAQTGIHQLPDIPFHPAKHKVSKKVAKMVERAAKIAEGLDSSNAPSVAEKSAHIKVKETVRLFNKHYLHLVQEEEKRCGAGKVAKKAARAKKAAGANKARKGNVPDADGKGRAKRPDLKAMTKMMERKEVLYPQKRIGNIPGIDVGHQFYSRAEMVAVGFHSHWLSGIDYMGQSYREGEYKHYKFPLAVAIVLSGMYEDDLDNAEDVVYTGEGGHALTGNKRQIRDQVLKRGNLALKNCYDLGVSIRVVRGHECTSSYSGKVYTYDGLYKVEKYWAEKGLSGFTVFKYRLRRLEGQPTLTTSQVQFVNGRVPQCTSEIRGLVCEDISGGQEIIPIPATNMVDDPPVAPTGYEYCKSMKVARNIKLPANASRCDCEGICWDPKTCSCARLNGSDFPYVHRDGGRLVEAKHVVFECGPNCGCSPDCVNRTSQRGLKYRLEVFRTPKKGWAVRSWDFIPAGAPVCEYIGVLTRTEDLDSVSENNYIFDIDCLQTMRGLGGRASRQQDASVSMIQNVDKNDEQRSESVPEFCIDAASIGNVARFINHSCEPNLFIQCVLSAHQDIKLARVVLFAADNIPPLQELTYDYGYALDSVHGPDGKVKMMPCFCGAVDCRKRLF
ncbi:SET DOMAIN PROTEIN 33, SU(VAR)3-9 homolog 4, KRYPTONITE [Hibiscus trionum]|uniref:SET DOMAIN PROTEIN 33, SU(VAR)3-9 homolog 4, KRYPTONITE n=1 Tax=Hibiscus trionum TaxID=183268 RepID=A0A9W7I0K8_HIBTR|nr:SET DOMAIN PROTEIN 33, SU(VAR)3-9 homolog 4, KRYPTONITE [Hibiscus trionum]